MSTGSMTEAEYLALANQAVELARQVAQLPVERMLDVVRRTHTLGPILDPTAYKAGMANLRDMEELLEPMLGLKATVQAIVARAVQEARGRLGRALLASAACGCRMCTALVEAGLPGDAAAQEHVMRDKACAHTLELARARERLALMGAHADVAP